MDKQRPIALAVIGAAVSANKGAASMLFGLLDGLADAGYSAEVELLTTYERADRAVLEGAGTIPEHCSVHAVNASPLMLLAAFLLSLPIRLLDRLRVPIGPLGRVPLIKAVRKSDLTVDLAGISFADGRGVALLGYNSVMSLFPFLAGGNVVKGSQAIGPCKQLPTRTAARLVLPHMATICARGAETRRHLDTLGLRNVVDAADIAFLMHGREPSGALKKSLPPRGDGQSVVILPSSVVDSYASAAGIDHITTMAQVVTELSDSGATVLVAPHSFRTNGERGRMNDGPVVDDIERRAPGRAVYLNQDLDPRELRVIIEQADVVVTGRFHGMVSALAIGTPPIVIGWSHKYGEVLDQFGLGAQAIPVEELTADKVLTKIRDTLAESAGIKERMRQAQPAVYASAQRNIEVVVAGAQARAAK